MIGRLQTYEEIIVSLKEQAKKIATELDIIADNFQREDELAAAKIKRLKKNKEDIESQLAKNYERRAEIQQQLLNIQNEIEAITQNIQTADKRAAEWEEELRPYQARLEQVQISLRNQHRQRKSMVLQPTTARAQREAAEIRRQQIHRSQQQVTSTDSEDWAKHLSIQVQCAKDEIKNLEHQLQGYERSKFLQQGKLADNGGEERRLQRQIAEIRLKTVKLLYFRSTVQAIKAAQQQQSALIRTSQHTIMAEQLKIIDRYITADVRIEKLEIAGFSQEHLEHLTALLRNPNARIKKLVLRGLGLQDEQLALVIAALVENPLINLEELDLSENTVGVQSAEHLSRALKVVTTLKILKLNATLNQSQISEVETNEERNIFQSLVTGLSNNSSLEIIELENNNLDAVSIEQMFVALSNASIVGRQLKHINFNCNRKLQDAGLLLADLLDIATIRGLDLIQCDLSQGDQEALLKKLEKRLKEINEPEIRKQFSLRFTLAEISPKIIKILETMAKLAPGYLPVFPDNAAIFGVPSNENFKIYASRYEKDIHHSKNYFYTKKFASPDIAARMLNILMATCHHLVLYPGCDTEEQHAIWNVLTQQSSFPGNLKTLYFSPDCLPLSDPDKFDKLFKKIFSISTLEHLWFSNVLPELNENGELAASVRDVGDFSPQQFIRFFELLSSANRATAPKLKSFKIAINWDVHTSQDEMLTHEITPSEVYEAFLKAANSGKLSMLEEISVVNSKCPTESYRAILTHPQLTALKFFHFYEHEVPYDELPLKEIFTHPNLRRCLIMESKHECSSSEYQHIADQLSLENWLAQAKRILPTFDKEDVRRCYTIEDPTEPFTLYVSYVNGAKSHELAYIIKKCFWKEPIIYRHDGTQGILELTSVQVSENYLQKILNNILVQLPDMLTITIRGNDIDIKQIQYILNFVLQHTEMINCLRQLSICDNSLVTHDILPLISQLISHKILQALALVNVGLQLKDQASIQNFLALFLALSESSITNVDLSGNRLSSVIVAMSQQLIQNTYKESGHVLANIAHWLEETHAANTLVDILPDDIKQIGLQNAALRERVGVDPIDSNQLIYTEDEASVLGRGACSVVYKGTYQNKTVAIKKLIAVDPTIAATFKQEVEILARQNSPYVIKIFAARLEPRGSLIIMEYFSEGTLREWLYPKEAQRITIDNFTLRLYFCLNLCTGVAALHGDLVLHRDLKPDNLLIAKNQDGRYFLKIADFGLAKLKPEEENPTLLSGLQGTPRYMAREQAWDGGKYHVRASDVWSMGVILYEILLNERPYNGCPDHTSIIQTIREGNLPFSVNQTPLISQFVPEYLKLIRQCWASKTSERPTAKQLVEATQAAQEKIKSIPENRHAPSPDSSMTPAPG